MATEQCFGVVCFFRLDPAGPKFFGFSEFLAGLALMVLVWTIADMRYRFRVQTAPIPLQDTTFLVVAAFGVLTLLTDLWRAEGWLVPSGNLLTPALWQALLGGFFLVTFLMWAWFAFIRPPVFGTRNAARFGKTLYRHILKGSPTELAIIGDELARSAKSLVHHATDRTELENNRGQRVPHSLVEPPIVEAYANDLLLLIADKRFCRAVVESSPGTALAFFHEISESKKYGIPIRAFAKNIVNEALMNRDSFIYHEVEGYESGLIGHHKPLCQAMFSNFRMVETIGSILDPDIWGETKWNAYQWEAYSRLVLMTFRDYVARNFESHSIVLCQAIDYIEHSISDICKLEGVVDIPWDNDALARLRVVVKFVKTAVEILDEKGVPSYVQLRIRKQSGQLPETFYDHLASMICEIIFAASSVTSPIEQCWWIQHNSVWAELFNFTSLNSAAGKVVKFKVRRLLYEQIARMKRVPNYKGARILGFCLNVMGLTASKKHHDKDSRALHKAVLAWTRRYYVWLHEYDPRIAEACLVDGLTYDAQHLRLVKTNPNQRLMRDQQFVFFELQASPAHDDDGA